jgi:hypothetical protein
MAITTPLQYLRKYQELKVWLPGDIVAGESPGGSIDVDLPVRLYSNTGTSGTKRQNVKGHPAG